MRLRTLALLAAVPLAGCYPFINTGTYNQSFCDLDEDGDGVTKCTVDDNGERQTLDCDDSAEGELSPLRFPGNTEIPYDGVDNDCEGGDLLDVDGDRFAGISREDYEALGRDPWPSDLQSGFDCNDDDDSIYPGAPDTPYDGIDSDCAADCDYDVDGDDLADARQGQDNDCGLPATDCLDSDVTVFPGASGEVYYDGVDQDCDGVNDYDPDGDGFAWAGYEDLNTEFLDRHGYTDTITAYTECYDVDDAPLPSAEDTRDPKVVNPGVAESFYDGLDGNCSDLDEVVENDWDRDGDGYVRSEPGDRALFLAYVDRYVSYQKHDETFPYKAAFEAAFGATSAEWGAWFDAHDNDCNDADATVHPGALEKLGDSIDQDCDGGVDTTPFQFGGFSWDGLGNPVVRATDSDFVLAAVATDGVDLGSGTLGTRVTSLSFALDADNTVTPTQESSPSTAGSSDTFSPALGMVAFSNGYYVSHAFVRNGNTRLLGAVATLSGTKYSNISVQNSDRVSDDLTYTETDMQCDAATSTCWVVACDANGVQYAEYTDSKATSGFSEVLSGDAAISNVDCFITTEDANGTLLINTVAASGAVSAWKVDEAGFLSPATLNPFLTADLDHASSHDEWLILGGELRGITLWRDLTTQRSVLATRATDHADASFLGSTAYVSAVGGSNVYLAYGNPTGSMTEVTVPFADEAGVTFTPSKIAIEAAGSRVLMVVTGTDSSGDDVLGWAFLEI